MAEKQDTKKASSTISSEVVARMLDACGYTESVAGDEFGKSVRAVKTCIDSGMGLLISGDVGCGKTCLLKALAKWSKVGPLGWIYVKDPQRMSHLRGSPEYFYSRSIFIDDIGSETKIHEYGNTVDIVGDFIQLYHEFGRGKLYASTNLSSAGLNERYDSRVVDRLLDMCVVYVMKGDSKRRRVVV